MIQIGLLLFQGVIYWGTQFIQKNPHPIKSRFDDRIPFIPQFIFAYVSWFLFLASMPIILYFYYDTVFAIYVMALFIEEIIAGIVFIVYPTTFDRPEPVGKGPAIWVVKAVYKNDSKTLSCLPSLHCGIATLFILGSLSCPDMPLWLKVIIVTVSVLIIQSTVFVKQHMIIDMVTAIPLSLLCWYIATVITPEVFLVFFKFI
ncbi:MAG: hypothetical protein WCY62_09925 [Clostridia bacterium]